MNGKSQKEINKEHEQDINNLYDHAKVANEEMGSVQKSLAVAKNDIEWIKKKISTMDKRLWAILISVIIGILVQIFLSL